MTQGRLNAMGLAVAVLTCATLAGCRGPAPQVSQQAVSRGPESSSNVPVTFVARSMTMCERLPPVDARTGVNRVSTTNLASDNEPRKVVLASAIEPQLVSAAVPPENIGSDRESRMVDEPLGQLPSAEQLPGARLTLAELEQLALANNPTLRQAAAQVAQARGNWEQVGLYPNPQVVAVQAANNSPFDSFNLFVTQPVVRGDKLQLNRSVAAFDIQRAGWEASAQRTRVLNDVQIRYVMLLAARQRVVIAIEMLDLARRGVEVSERLRTEEEIAESDVLQVRLQYEQARLFLRDVQFQAAEASKRLADIVGRPDLQECPLEGTLDENVPELNYEAACEQLLARSPQLAAVRSRMNAARAQTQRELAQPVPNVALTGGVGNDFFHPQYMMYSFFMGVDVPIFNRNQGNIAAASAEARKAQREIDRLQLALRNDLATVFQRYESARNEAIVYRDVMLPTARRNLSIVERSFEEGEGDVLRVRTARRNLYQVQIGQTDALAQLRSAVIEIEGHLLTGGLLPISSEPTKANSAGQTATPGYYWK